MKTFLACILLALVGSAFAFSVNNHRFGKYEPAFGPMDYNGDVTAENAMANMQKNWNLKRPKVVLPDGNEYDFGVMKPSEEGEHLFRIRNEGEEDLTLEVGASTCKCTIGTLNNNILKPGEETEVKLAWTVKTNETTFGQSAELRTNDPQKVAIRLEIRGQVVRQIQLVPEKVTFGETAAGEAVEFELKCYSYMEEEIAPQKATFSNEELDELTTVEITPIELSESDGVHQTAKQGFQIKGTIQPGLKQGPINENLSVEFTGGSVDEPATSEEGEPKSRYFYCSVSGRIVGALSMLPSSKLKGVSGGGYLYNFGKLEADDPLTAKAFVVLKGSARESTNLSIGETSPAEHVEASLAKPIGKGSMSLYSLELKLKPGEKKVELLGMNQDDYGFVMIESDNPKVPPLKLRLKFSLPAR